jgi:hypothetical protein
MESVQNPGMMVKTVAKNNNYAKANSRCCFNNFAFQTR